MKRAFWISILLCLSACSTVQAVPVSPTPEAPLLLPTPTTPPTAMPHQSTPVPIDIFAASRLLRRTVNLGNALEAPHEGDWGVILQEGYFKTIAAAGFTAVRVPIDFADHALPSGPFTIEPGFFDRIDWVVRNASANGLVAILDMHNYQAMMDRPATEKVRFMALWKQIAEHYRDAPNDRVFFELLNEPNGALDNSAWSAIAGETLAVVRQSNPTRPVIIGPSSWNSFDQVQNLQLPPDPDIIVTFHYYLPFHFTHQGAEWVDGSNAWLGTLWTASPAELTAIDNDFGRVQSWAKLNDRPVFLGEFGAYSKGDQASRVRWTAAVARAAEAHGFAWGYWEFCAGFGVYDPVALQWRPDLLNALIPNP
ncbi:MAG TPA: glycoside hydrolase family 5 protein [Anaerolineales bacterium]|nr:glycoside hydrolase family 5 protein [Anaerolineales bacterium]